MRSRSSPALVACAVLAVAALATRSGLQSRTVSAPPARAAAVAVAPAASAGSTTAAPDANGLPGLAPGASRTEFASHFRRDAVVRRIEPAAVSGAETWEWSEPAGRYALAVFAGGHLVAATVRRPYGDALPPVDAARLPALAGARTRADVERLAGHGLAVARSVDRSGFAALTEAWAIRDRGLATGGVLRITSVGAKVVSVEHPWAKR